MAAAMMLGAEGFLIGAPCCALDEADDHLDAKRRIFVPSGGDTVRSIILDISRKNVGPEPYTGRVLRKRHGEPWLSREAETVRDAAKALHDYAEAHPRWF